MKKSERNYASVSYSFLLVVLCFGFNCSANGQLTIPELKEIIMKKIKQDYIEQDSNIVIITLQNEITIGEVNRKSNNLNSLEAFRKQTRFCFMAGFCMRIYLASSGKEINAFANLYHFNAENGAKGTLLRTTVAKGDAVLVWSDYCIKKFEDFSFELSFKDYKTPCGAIAIITTYVDKSNLEATKIFRNSHKENRK
jgi:hypothetical protein